MQHLNLYRFYELATKLHGLFSVDAQTRAADMFGPLTEAQTAIDTLIKGDPITLESSMADAVKLLNKMGDLFNKYFIDPTTKQLKAQGNEDRPNQHEVALLRSLVEKFEHALAAELNRSPSFIVEKCGIYSTSDLIENAFDAFPANLQVVISPVAQTEFNTAGRCIAFGLGTAASVHLLRAIEVVLRQYYEIFAGSSAAKGERSYTIFLKKLTLMVDDETLTSRPDKRILQMLAQIKDHYRNPLITPETTLGMEQAMSLFGLSSAIISMMAEAILAKKKGSSKRDAKSAVAAMEKDTDEDGDDESYDFRSAQSA